MEPHAAKSLLEQGRIAKREHRLEDARNLFQKALEEGDVLELRAALCEELAYVERSLRHLETSKEHYLRSSEIYSTLANPLKTAHTMRHAADILREQRESEQADILYSKAIEIYRGAETAPPLDLGNAIRGFALLKEDTGDRAQALRLWQEAAVLYRLVGIEAGISESAARIKSLSE